MHIQLLPHHQYLKTVLLAVAASMVVVGTAALLGRATLNLRAALTDKPDVGVLVLMEDENPISATLLRENETERTYLVHTEKGPELVKMHRGKEQWFIEYREPLHAE